MTFKEFLKMNENYIIEINIYDKNGKYLMCKYKSFFLNNNVLLNEKVISFWLEFEDIAVKLDFDPTENES